MTREMARHWRHQTCLVAVLESKSRELVTLFLLETCFDYVGESSRSAWERVGGHWRDYTTSGEKSHMLKHSSRYHKNLEKPTFQLNVVKYCRSTLQRQIFEAVRISVWSRAGIWWCGGRLWDPFILAVAGTDRIYDREQLLAFRLPPMWDWAVTSRTYQ